MLSSNSMADLLIEKYRRRRVIQNSFNRTFFRLRFCDEITLLELYHSKYLSSIIYNKRCKSLWKNVELHSVVISIGTKMFFFSIRKSMKSTTKKHI